MCTTPFILWKVDNSVTEARFLSPEDTKKAVERLRANNTGANATGGFKWAQVGEAFLDLKTYLFFGMSLCINVGASVITVMGPLVLSGIGFDKYTTSLLNMPLGAIQILVICFSSYAAYRWRVKSVVLLVLILIVLTGMVLLYGARRPRHLSPHHACSSFVQPSPRPTCPYAS